MLAKADEYTEKYMEDNSQVFPEASSDVLIEKIKKGCKGFPSMQDYAIHLMKVLDKNNDGFVDVSEFSNGLKSLNVFCSKHEEHALMRRFDLNGDGKISMEEFYNVLAASF
jgi:Ca2+-binding EF-hand superfamily protein